uniref:Piwi domain-containing protein n=1 Tax=Setaria digitata TaxID=48799 RepID=A0A915PQ71_9BILA
MYLCDGAVSKSTFTLTGVSLANHYCTYCRSDNSLSAEVAVIIPDIMSVTSGSTRHVYSLPIRNLFNIVFTKVIFILISGGRARGRKVPQPELSETSSVGGGDMASLSSSFLGLNVSSQEPKGDEGNTLPVMSCLLQRFDYGDIGAEIPLTANYYEIKISQGIYIHRYEVVIRDPVKDRRINRDICRAQFWKVASNDFNTFGKLENLIYNDANCLWAKEKLNLPNGIGRKEITKTTSRGDERLAYIMEIKYTNTFLIDFAVELDVSRSVCVQFMNSLLTQSIRCPLRSISTHYYPFGHSVYIVPDQNRRWVVPVGGGIEAWTGLHGVVKIDSSGHSLFNADVSSCSFFKMRINLIDFFLEVLNEFRGRRPGEYTMNELRQANKVAMNDSQRKSLKKALTGVYLRLIYGPERNRLKDYKFVDVGQPANVLRFLHKNPNDPNDQGNEVTVEDYFAHYKEIRLNFPHLPVIQIGPHQKKIFVPMELLVIADKPQKVKRELTDFQRAKYIRGAAMPPEMRKERINTIIADQRYHDDIFLQNFGVRISSDMTHLNGRVLSPPKLELCTGDDGQVFHVRVDNGRWPLQNVFTTTPKNVLFGVICVDKAIDINDFWDPYRVLTRACTLFGMKFLTADPLLAKWKGEDREKLRAVVRNMARECNIRYKGNENLIVLFIMVNKNARMYGTIKTVCDLEEGIACQVILAKTFRNMSSRPETNTTAHNIILKINAKLGGVNNKVHQDYYIWPKFSNKDDPTIFIGVDITHPRPGKIGNSIASVVGSTNLDATRYEASTKVQHPKMERVVYLVDALRERLLSFYKSVGTAPKHIIIYRDGISESEFLNTLREEIASVKTACKRLDSEYSPTLAYVVVQKRHNTRFFVESALSTRVQNSRETRGNIPPGTVVDTCVTSSRHFDFFLCSHFGSVHLTFALCHLYARCNRSVSIPAPVYYAHLACARAGVHSDILYGGPSSDSQSGGLSPSEQETIHTHQLALAINAAAPKMYFI